MKQAIKNIFLFVLPLVCCATAVANQPTYDYHNFVRAGEILAKSTEGVKELNKVKEEAKRTGDALKGGMTMGGLHQWLKGNQTYLKSALDGMFSSQANNQALHNQKFMGASLNLNRDGKGKNENISTIQDNVSKSLYVSPENELTAKNVEETQARRDKAVEHAAVTSVAVAGDKKATLGNTQKKISEVSFKAMESDNLHADLVHTNQLLALVATELTQNRELMAQLLELTASTAIKSSAIMIDNPKG
jgi:hypothetical protein